MKNAAFERLYARYSNEAKLYVCSLTHNAALAEEIVQEAFSRALTSIEEEKDGFKYWLFKVCRNCYFDYLRKSKRVVPIDDAMKSGEEELADRVIRADEYRALYRAIGKLSEDYREAVMLFYFNGLSIAEIADILSKSADSVKVRLFRARAKLKSILEAENEL